MAATTDTDESLWSSYAEADDESAFSELYNRHYTHLLDYAGRYLNRPEEDLADDLVQQAFTDVIAHRSHHPHIENFAGFLYACAKRRVIDHQRHERAAMRQQPKKFAFIDNLDSLADQPHDNPVDICGAVTSALDRLDVLQKLVVKLYFFDHLTMPEIAEQLGVRLSTIKSRIRRSLIYMERSF